MDKLESPSQTAPDPGILPAVQRVVAESTHVRIVPEQLASRAQTWHEAGVVVPPWNRDLHFHDGTERTVNYVLVLDALNFSFWPEPHKERWSVYYGGEEYGGYWGLAAALRRAIEEGIPLWDATWLADLTGGKLAHVLRGRGEMPMMAERLANLREVGKVLQRGWDGQFARMVETAQGSAVRLAGLVASQFKSFHDVMRWKGHPVPILKRAQIVAIDLAGTFNFDRWGKFNDLEHLTAFADYKLPQILRHWGVLEYSPELAARVDAGKPLRSGEPMEVEIRAATIWAVELLRRALNEAITDGRPPYKAYEIDWALWAASQEPAETMQPYHKVRTVYY